MKVVMMFAVLFSSSFCLAQADHFSVIIDSYNADDVAYQNLDSYYKEDKKLILEGMKKIGDYPLYQQYLEMHQAFSDTTSEKSYRNYQKLKGDELKDLLSKLENPPKELVDRVTSFSSDPVVFEVKTDDAASGEIFNPHYQNIIYKFNAQDCTTSIEEYVVEQQFINSRLINNCFKLQYKNIKTLIENLIEQRAKEKRYNQDIEATRDSIGAEIFDEERVIFREKKSPTSPASIPGYKATDDA